MIWPEPSKVANSTEENEVVDALTFVTSLLKTFSTFAAAFKPPVPVLSNINLSPTL